MKSIPEKNLTYYGEAAGELGHYEEQFGEQNWVTTDSTALILGYECIIDETDYHGRHWRVWFSPELQASKILTSLSLRKCMDMNDQNP